MSSDLPRVWWSELRHECIVGDVSIIPKCGFEDIRKLDGDPDLKEIAVDHALRRYEKTADVEEVTSKSKESLDAVIVEIADDGTLKADAGIQVKMAEDGPRAGRKGARARTGSGRWPRRGRRRRLRRGASARDRAR